MSTDRFRTKNGRLTWYALTCGYIDVYEKNNIRTTLYKLKRCPVCKAEFKRKD